MNLSTSQNENVSIDGVVEKVRAQLTESREDSERLNWVLNEPCVDIVVCTYDNQGNVTNEWVLNSREHIDEAMKGGE